MPLSRPDCRGVWVPLVTPFRDQAIDFDAIPTLVERFVGSGIRGFLALGTTGEAAHCDEAESEAVVRAVVRAAGGRWPVLAGSGRPSTFHTLAASRRLAAAGAEGVLVLTPHLYRARMDAAALHHHYSTVAAGAGVPVFVYHMPGATGFDLESEVLAELVQIPNVWGFKDSTTQGGPLAATLRQVETQGFVGAGARVVAGLEAGACGVIVAIANLVPEVCVELYDAWGSGRHADANRLQAALAAVSHAVGGWGVAGVKVALESRGIPAGETRAPLLTPPASVRRAIEAAVDDALAAR